MDVAEFYSWVRETVNRGATLDSVLPHYIRAAVREIENKQDFKQLEWWGTFTLTPADDPIITLPVRLQKVQFVRFNSEETAGDRPQWNYLVKGTPPAQISRKSDMPKRYWQKGRDKIVLDAELDSKDRDFEVLVTRYSEWPDEANGSGESHWLLDAIPNGLHAKVMLSLSGHMRQQSQLLLQTWQALAREAIADLIMEDEYAREDQGPAQMEYWPEHIPKDKGYQDTETS